MPDATPPPSDGASAGLGRPFWTLWGSSAGANLADGLLKTALPLIAVTLTRDPVKVSWVTTALGLPWLLVSLPAGAWVDRWDRRVTMVAADTVRVVAVAGLAVAAGLGHLSMPLLWAAALTIGCAEVFGDTAAQTILPQLVAPSGLSRANARLYGVEVATNQFVGPPLGGVLVAAGAALAFAVPAAAWLAGIGGLLLLPGRYRVAAPAQRGSLLADIGDGLRFLLHHPTLRTLAVMTGLFNLSSSLAGAVFVLFAVGAGSAMGLTSAQYGLLLTTIAVGSILGSVVAARIEARLGRLRSLAVATATGMVATAAPALTSSPWVIGALWAVEGVFIMVWNVVVVSLRQSLAPAHLLGRLNSAYRMLAWGTLPVGAAIGGAVAGAVGLRWTFALAAALIGGVVALVPVLSRAGLDPEV